jgi:Ner family transcriptional regulator
MTYRPRSRDWHRAEVLAALRMTPEHWTMAGLSRAHAYSVNAISEACRHPWPAVERIVADALGMEPQEIWPSRYRPDGTPRQGVPTSKLPPRPRRRRSTRQANEAK